MYVTHVQLLIFAILLLPNTEQTRYINSISQGGDSALIAASGNGHKEVAALLIVAEANVNVQGQVR